MAKTPTPPPADDTAVTGKGRATPTRKEREAANKRPLVPSDRRQAARMSKDQLAAQRERARVGMAAGQEQYLPQRDRGPQKRYTRDFVDARWSVGEVLLPLLALVIVTYFFPTIAQYALFGVWIVIAIVVIDGIVIGFQLNRRLTAKFGSMERGVRWYAFMRAIQLRPMRMPKPQVKRGQYPS